MVGGLGFDSSLAGLIVAELREEQGDAEVCFHKEQSRGRSSAKSKPLFALNHCLVCRCWTFWVVLGEAMQVQELLNVHHAKCHGQYGVSWLFIMLIKCRR